MILLCKIFIIGDNVVNTVFNVINGIRNQSKKCMYD